MQNGKPEPRSPHASSSSWREWVSVALLFAVAAGVNYLVFSHFKPGVNYPTDTYSMRGVFKIERGFRRDTKYIGGNPGPCAWGPFGYDLSYMCSIPWRAKHQEVVAEVTSYRSIFGISHFTTRIVMNGEVILEQSDSEKEKYWWSWFWYSTFFVFFTIVLIVVSIEGVLVRFGWKFK
jgi:hypothetical protein